MQNNGKFSTKKDLQKICSVHSLVARKVFRHFRTVTSVSPSISNKLASERITYLVFRFAAAHRWFRNNPFLTDKDRDMGLDISGLVERTHRHGGPTVSVTGSKNKIPPHLSQATARFFWRMEPSDKLHPFYSQALIKCHLRQDSDLSSFSKCCNGWQGGSR